MNNPQKLVFTMLVAILALEFGSLTKLRTIWSLAFTGTAPSSSLASPTNQNAGSSQGSTQVYSTEPYHPTSGQTQQE